MTHLSPDELIDLAEGARAESGVPHLAGCAACRRQLADLRVTLSHVATDGADVPEPSPLFWEHFSARVHEAVAAEGAPRRRDRWYQREWFGVAGPPQWAGALPLAGAVALVAVAVALTSYVAAPRVPDSPASAAVTVVADAASLSPLEATGDPVLSLIADLMADLDLEGANEALLPSPAHAGDADDVVSTLTEDERRELQRLLQEELAKPRA